MKHKGNFVQSTGPSGSVTCPKPSRIGICRTPDDTSHLQSMAHDSKLRVPQMTSKDCVTVMHKSGGLPQGGCVLLGNTPDKNWPDRDQTLSTFTLLTQRPGLGSNVLFLNAKYIFFYITCMIQIYSYYTTHNICGDYTGFTLCICLSV